MKRKIMSLGRTCLVVSLPSKWHQKYNLKKGDELELSELDNTLVIGQTTKTEKKKTIEFDVYNKSLLRVIVSQLYRLGYSELTLKFREEQPYADILDVVHNLKGYEIVSSDLKKTCIIRDVMRTDINISISEVVIKMFQKINLLFELVIERINDLSKNDNDIIKLREEIMKDREYCQREAVLLKTDNSYEYYNFIMSLEKIAGEYYHIFTAAHKLKIKIGNESIHLLKDHQDLFRELYSVFLKKDFEPRHMFYLKIRDLCHKDWYENNYIKLLNEKKYEEEVVLCCDRLLQYLLMLSSRIQNLIV
ncbi:MAG: AbrB/MazE/SpoVT family DNA-binding domain-containing protein [archaeon]